MVKRNLCGLGVLSGDCQKLIESDRNLVGDGGDQKDGEYWDQIFNRTFGRNSSRPKSRAEGAKLG